MKKKIITLTIASVMLLGGVVSAASMWGTYKGNEIVRLTVNDVPVQVKDAPAFIYDNRTMVPIYLLEQAGVLFSWDSKTKTVDILKQTHQNPSGYTTQTVDRMKLTYKISAHFDELTSLGGILVTASSGVSDAYDAVYYNSQVNIRIQAARTGLGSAIDSYNDFLSVNNKLVADAKNTFEIDISPNTTGIINDYYKSIDILKNMMAAIDRYSVSGSRSDVDTYFSELEKFNQLVFPTIKRSIYYKELYFSSAANM